MADLFERTLAARSAATEAQERFEAEALKLDELAKADGCSGFIILKPGPLPDRPIDLTLLKERIWFGAYRPDDLEQTLYLHHDDSRVKPLYDALGSLTKAQAEYDRAKIPIRPRGWRGESPGDVGSLEQLRDYVSYVLSLEGERSRRQFPLGEVLLNVDNALVTWCVPGSPEVSPEPKADDDARRALLGKLHWLNSAVELAGGDSAAKRTPDAKPNEGTPKQVNPKRSTQPGEAREKLVAALCQHHGFDGDSCSNYEPIGSNELCRKAGVLSTSTGTAFFQREFDGLDQYRAACRRDRGTGLVKSLRALRGETRPSEVLNYGRRPPGEGRDDDE